MFKSKNCCTKPGLTYKRTDEKKSEIQNAKAARHFKDKEEEKKLEEAAGRASASTKLIPKFSNDTLVNIQELCEKLNCPQMSYQIEKLTAAQDQLMRIQHRELFDRIFGSDYLCFRGGSPVNDRFFGVANGALPVADANAFEGMGEEEELICFGSDAEVIELLPENEWHGFFKGYQILTEANEFSLKDIKKCVELCHQDNVETLETYLRAGVRCFIIDLFKGNVHSNQTLVVRFRQSELNVAKELGFPVTSTLFSRISPRLQYTGYLENPQESLMLYKHEYLTLTTDRYWANRGTKRRIFVNARYLLGDTCRCDILLVGTEIQLQVARVLDDSLRCKVLVGGKLRSRMPVLFHKRCQRFRISFCELEDITFVKEVGINVIVLDMLGTPAYLNNLRESLKLLKCDNIRIFARVVLNNIDDDDLDVEWIHCAYDGFLGELSTFSDGCGGDGNFEELDDLNSTRILFLSPKISSLIERAHRAKKPFIFDPSPLVDDQYILDPACYKHILYHPDKYLFRCEYYTKSSPFYMLANVLAAPMPEEEINKLMPYCDTSHTGSDTLALATAAASFELNASCIFVLGITGRMVAKIACFRPKATIYFISSLKSAADYISIYHNVVMLYYCPRQCPCSSYQRSVYKELLFGLSYAVALKALKHGEHVLFVYGQKPGQLFPDKYVAYKFDAKNFVKELATVLF